MTDLKSLIGILEWGIVITLTIISFSYFSKIYKKYIILLFAVLLPVWIVTSIVHEFIRIYFEESYISLPPWSIVRMFASSLPITMFIGGLTFYYRYKRFKKEQ